MLKDLYEASMKFVADEISSFALYFLFEKRNNYSVLSCKKKVVSINIYS